MEQLHLIIEFIFSLCLFANAVLFVPQIIKVLKTKHSNDLSLLTFSGFCFIQLFTLLHALLKKDYLLAIGFGVSLISCGFLTILIIIYRRK